MKRVMVVAPKKLVNEVISLGVDRWGIEIVPRPLELIGSTREAFQKFLHDSLHDRGQRIDGVVGLNDSGSLLAAMLATRMNFPGPSIVSVLNAQQKLWSRKVQALALPKNTPRFEALEHHTAFHSTAFGFPMFVKPMKSQLSQYSYRVNDAQELEGIIAQWRNKYSVQNDDMAQLFQCLTDDECCGRVYQNKLIAEELIGAPIQVTVDGWVQGERIELFGITRSEFVPGTISFGSFHYPYITFPEDLRKNCEAIVERLVRAIGLDHTLFNVELKCDPAIGRVWIIEINSRMSAQFMPMIHAVTGIHPFRVATAIAIGGNPTSVEPDDSLRRTVSSCFILRREHDAFVRRVPTFVEREKIEREAPGVHIGLFIPDGFRLSQGPQDPQTFRYAQVIVSAVSEEEARALYARVRVRLDPLFKFE